MLNETMKDAEIPVVEDAEQRILGCKLVIGIAKQGHFGIFGDNGRFGAEVDAVFVMCAVMLGHAEGRPMTAHKIALYLGMPRPTVLRKLDVLQDLNVVTRIGASYVVTKARLAKSRHKKLLGFVRSIADKAL